MKEYSYIGVAEDLTCGAKYLVRSSDCNIHNCNIVSFKFNCAIVYAKVLYAAFLPIGCEEESMLAEFGEIYEVEEIYGLAWKKKEEEKEDGN